LEEGSEYAFGVVEIVVDYIDEIRGVHEVRDELSRRGIVVVNVSPLLP
jgi:hypothetical protein